MCVSHLLCGDKGKQWFYHLYPDVVARDVMGALVKRTCDATNLFPNISLVSLGLKPKCHQPSFYGRER